jgi:pimeloyl-ACP methyl ester carboxylesterase
MNIVVNNLLINYTDQGNGKIMLILHGWGDSLNSFDNLAKILSKKFRIVRLDLPGFGGSEAPRSPWAVIDYAKFIKDFCSKIDAQPQILLGHSFGGRIIIKLIAQNLLNPQKIILIASAGIRQSGSLRNNFFKIAAKGGKVIASIPGIKKYKKKMRHKLYDSIKSNDYLEAGAMKQTFLNVIKEDLREDASKILIPTLLIWGKDDKETPLAQAYELNHRIRDSHLEILSNAGHFVFLDKPLEVHKLIEGFLQ